MIISLIIVESLIAADFIKHDLNQHSNQKRRRKLSKRLHFAMK